MKGNDHRLMKRSDPESTVVATPPETTGRGGVQKPVTVAWLVDGEKQTAKFTQTITIGRDDSCDVCVKDESVSRQHVQIWCEAGRWHIADLNSGNGTFLDRVLVQEAVLPRKSTLRLGSDGPKIWIKVPGASGGASVAEIAEHYFGDPGDGEVGHRTMLVRRAYRKVEKTQKRRYRNMIAGAVGLLSISIGIGIYQFLMLQKTRELATDMFYNMKTVQVQVAQLEELIRESGDTKIATQVNARFIKGPVRTVSVSRRVVRGANAGDRAPCCTETGESRARSPRTPADRARPTSVPGAAVARGASRSCQ